jgi:hypothetical protein
VTPSSCLQALPVSQIPDLFIPVYYKTSLICCLINHEHSLCKAKCLILPPNLPPAHLLHLCWWPTPMILNCHWLPISLSYTTSHMSENLVSTLDQIKVIQSVLARRGERAFGWNGVDYVLLSRKCIHEAYFVILSVFCTCMTFPIRQCFIYCCCLGFLSWFLSFICWDRVWLCSAGWPQTPEPPALASQGLGLQLWISMPVLFFFKVF